jgi:AcrR family transcriptional regulator
MTDPTEPSSRAYHHGDLRRALIDAATDLASAGGVEGVVVREVARQVGVSPSAAYRHFPSRDGLLAAVGGAARERLARRMLAAKAVDPRDHFRATGRAYITFALDEPGLFEVAFRPCPPDLYVPDDPSPYHVLSAALDTLARAGALAVPRAGAEEPAWAAVHGAAVLLGERMIPASERERVVAATLAMVGDGLLVPERDPRPRTLRR